MVYDNTLYKSTFSLLYCFALTRIWRTLRTSTAGMPPRAFRCVRSVMLSSSIFVATVYTDAATNRFTLQSSVDGRLIVWAAWMTGNRRTAISVKFYGDRSLRRGASMQHTVTDTRLFWARVKLAAKLHPVGKPETDMSCWTRYAVTVKSSEAWRRGCGLWQAVSTRPRVAAAFDLICDAAVTVAADTAATAAAAPVKPATHVLKLTAASNGR